MKLVHCRIKNPSVRIFHRVDEIPGEWDQILPYKHFLKRSTLRLTTEACLPDIDHLFTAFYEAGKLIGVAYFQVLHVRKYHLSTDDAPLLQKLVWNIITSAMNPKLLVAGHLFHHEITTFYTPVEAPYESYRIYSSMMDRCMEESNSNALLIKDLDPELATYFQNLRPKYIRLPKDISMEMRIDPEWKDVTDYEKSLKHKYAQRFRKIRHQMKDIEVRPLSVEEIHANIDRLFDLYRQVARRQKVRLGYLSAGYLPMLKKTFDRSFHLWAFYKDGKIVAFFSAWHYGDTFDMYYIGLDYEINKTHNLYFNMLFFGLEQAIDLRCRLLILGRTALEAKARLGCQPKYLSTFLFIRNRWLRAWISTIDPREEGEAWENRHPFLEKNRPVPDFLPSTDQ